MYVVAAAAAGVPSKTSLQQQSCTMVIQRCTNSCKTIPPIVSMVSHIEMVSSNWFSANLIYIWFAYTVSEHIMKHFTDYNVKHFWVASWMANDCMHTGLQGLFRPHHLKAWVATYRAFSSACMLCSKDTAHLGTSPGRQHRDYPVHASTQSPSCGQLFTQSAFPNT